MNRKYKHLYSLRNNNHGNQKLQRAYNKYGEENFVFEILEEVENKNDLIQIEQKYIDLLNPFYNICKIANSRIGVKATESTIKKQILAKLNQSKETREKISKTLKSKCIKRTQAEKDRISNKLKGVPFTKIHKDNISKGLKKYSKNRTESHKNKLLKLMINNKWGVGYKHSEDFKKKMSNLKTNYWKDVKSKGMCGKKIIQFDLNNKYIKTWNYICEAEIELNICNICLACSGKQQTAGGFKWQYESDGEIYKREKKINPKLKKVVQSDINGNIIKIWESIVSASTELGIKATNISLICRKKGKTTGGYVWNYYL